MEILDQEKSHFNSRLSGIWVMCKNKPRELEPIYLPNRETRPKDYLSSRRKITIQEVTLFLNINFIDIKQQYFTLQIVTY